MDINILKNRVDELIDLAGRVIDSYNESEDIIDYELFHEFELSSASFLRKVFGNDHPFYLEFDSRVKSVGTYYAAIGRGILKAAKKEIENGWLFTLQQLISSEIFSDFLEMAEHLLLQSYKDAAAVMIGSVLEEHLRHLGTKNSVDLYLIKDGKHVPKKADLLNSELAGKNAYNKLDQKSITSWLDLRNKAAHGQYDQYSKEQVELMYQGVSNFIARTK